MNSYLTKKDLNTNSVRYEFISFKIHVLVTFHMNSCVLGDPGPKLHMNSYGRVFFGCMKIARFSYRFSYMFSYRFFILCFHTLFSYVGMIACFHTLFSYLVFIWLFQRRDAVPACCIGAALFATFLYLFLEVSGGNASDFCSAS